MKYKCLEKLGLNKNEEKHKSKLMSFVNKVLTAILLGIICLLVMEYSPKFKTFMHEEVLGKNISFAFIGNLYNKYFGEVLPKKNDNVVEVFNEKLNYSKSEKLEDGYLLTVSNNYLVPTITSGIVVFIGEKENLGKVITIEGEDNATITYGNIKNTDLKLYDYVNKGKFLGEVEDKTLYIKIFKDGEYQDIETYLS